MRTQLALAGVNFAGLEVTVHGFMHSMTGDILYGGSLIVLGIGLMYATVGKG